jgi:hypothetical protein
VVMADVLVLATAVECFVWWAVDVAATFAGADDLPAKYAPTATPARTTTTRATYPVRRRVRRVTVKTASSSCTGPPASTPVELGR